ncbi:S1 family peptidase [Xanthomonas oryzae]|uniref:trypsin-like serine protease n=1 Tax=Xanthomonas oryzae TaxID=347 RepID=UPI001E3FCEAB|nr:trypsin-like serine protease [Xanthomonas oryzae]WDN10961.1 S1 family peptidase [Xanthomonas oryzae]WDN24468.1 S1 family peptidase [Xanthomonas oryzae]
MNSPIYKKRVHSSCKALLSQIPNTPDRTRSLMKTLQLQKGAACLAMAIATTLACSAAMAQVDPRNPERDALPVISGSKVGVNTGSCTAGAVVVPRNFLWRLTPYQNATRWLVLAKHCSLLGGTVYSRELPIGIVEWQSAASDLELVRVPPEPNPAYTWCQAHQNSGAAICNPYLQYRPRAHNRVFMPRGGREARVPVAGWSNAPDGQFCTSGWRTGVRCVWRGMSLGPGIAQPNYDHISAADGSEFVSLDGGDSGGPVVTYDMHLIGIISSSDERTRSILFYTPMSQVLQELHDYTLAPINTSDENTGWELAPADDDAGATQRQDHG